MQLWQEMSFPNCNTMHELDLARQMTIVELTLYAKGRHNQIFRMDESDKPYDPELVTKIL